MKRNTLLIAAGAMCASAYAIDQPTIIDNVLVTMFSPNSQWACCADDGSGVVTLINMATGELTPIFNPNAYYSPGLGNYLSNDAVIVGNTTESCMHDAAYYKDGVWTQLPLLEEDNGVCIPQGITPDSKRICGQVGRGSWLDEGKKVPSQIPVIWDLQADGEYGMYTVLPYPDKDFTGRLPQYVTALCISEDGKTVAGQVRDSSGFFNLPIVYRQAGNGEWSYEMAYDINPDNIVIPPAPGEGPTMISVESYMSDKGREQYEAALDEYNNQPMPEVTDFMSELEKEDYLEAVEAHRADPVNVPEPNPSNFMTANEVDAYDMALIAYNKRVLPSPANFMTQEEIDAYNAAAEKYNAEAEDWNQKFDAFNRAIETLRKNGASFNYNNVCMSQNAHYLAMTSGSTDFNTGESDTKIYLFDLAKGGYVVKDNVEDIYVSYVNNDGATLIGSPNTDYVRNAYISTSPDEPYVSLQDYMKEKNPYLYTWMDQNMRHTYKSLVPDFDKQEYVEVEHVNAWLTGTPTANPDLSIIGTFNYNCWDMSDDAAYYYSYILPMSATGGIESATVDANVAVKMAKGYIYVSAPVAKLEVYDLNGHCLFSAENPAPSTATGLPAGIYIVKITAENGVVVTAKCNNF